MSWLSTSSSPLLWLLLHFSVRLPLLVAGSSYFCGKNTYDSPDIRDCSYALAALPQADGFYRYYIEQQLATVPPQFDWQGWKDERPSYIKRSPIQVPKFWSYGSCNLALLSYVEGKSKTAVSFSRWADIYLAGYSLIQACLNLHSQGGAATIIGVSGLPVLTMFLWKNGATFDSTINKYTSAPFPAGIDPRTPEVVKAFGPFNSTVHIFNDTLPEGIDFVHPMSLANANALNSSSGPFHNTAVDSLLTEST